MKYHFLRVKSVLLLALLLASSISSTTSAIDETFYSGNDVLFSDKDACGGEGGSNCCTTNAAASGGAFTGAGAVGCGEQGYSSGKRDSKANKDQIWSYFKNKGLSDIAVAGIMGNVEIESSFMPDAVNNIGCSGFVQHCNGRKDNLLKSAQEKGKDWHCLNYQLDYVWNEITETAEKQVMEPLKAARTPGEAAMTWASVFERPAKDEYVGRPEAAEKIYQEYTGHAASPDLASSTSSGSQACTSSTTAGIAVGEPTTGVGLLTKPVAGGGRNVLGYKQCGDPRVTGGGYDWCQCGCSPTSLMIIRSSWEKEADIKSDDVFAKVSAAGGIAGGCGSSGNGEKDLGYLKEIGYKIEPMISHRGSGGITDQDLDMMKEKLKTGSYVFYAHTSTTIGSPDTANPGSTSGHFFVIYAYDDNGNFYAANPGRKENNNHPISRDVMKKWVDQITPVTR